MKRKQLTAAEMNAKIDELANEILRRLTAGEPVNLEELGLPPLTGRTVPSPKGKRRTTGAAGATR